MRAVVIKHKGIFEKAVIAYAEGLPEPTWGSCIHPNTHILFDIRDKFLKNETNPRKRALFEAAFKLLIAEYEHDPYYRYRLDWVLEQIIDSDWQPRKIRQEVHWSEE